MNCQSITLAFGPANARVLLAGDMQFAEPGVTGANAEVAKLRAKVKAAGPYRLYKTTHHTSHNGQNAQLLDDFGKPPLIVHTGGRKDPSHPFPATLKMLKQRKADIFFARTDRNGRITVEPHLAPATAITKSRGQLNDFSDNVTDDTTNPVVEVTGGAGETFVVTRTSGRSGGAQVVIVDLPKGPVNMTVAGVDIVVRGESGASEGETTPADPPGLTPPLSRTTTRIRLAGGRALPRLLFVTDAAKLAANIGRQEAAAALAAVRTGTHLLIDIAANRARPFELAQRALRANPTVNGIVILGGYDVVPSVNFDVLPQALRTRLGAARIASDADQFRRVERRSLRGSRRRQHRRAPGVENPRRARCQPVSHRVADGRSGADRTLRRAQRGASIRRHDLARHQGHARAQRQPAISLDAGAGGRDGEGRAILHAPRQRRGCHRVQRRGWLLLSERLHRGQGAAEVRRRRFHGMLLGRAHGARKSARCPRRSAGAAARGALHRAVLSQGRCERFRWVHGVSLLGPRHRTGQELRTAAAPGVLENPAARQIFRGGCTLWRAQVLRRRDRSRRHDAREPLDLARRLKNRAQFTCLGLGW